MSGGTLTANGYFTSNGAYTQNGGTATFNGTSVFNTVALGAGSAVSVNFNGATTIAALTMASGSNIPSLQGSGDITVTGASILDAGSFASGGNINFNGGLDITGSVSTDRTLNVTGGSMADGAALSDGGSGAFNLVGGTFTVGGSNVIDTAITIQGGTFDVLAGGTLNDNGSPTVINNGPSGTLNIDGQVYAEVSNDGTLSGVGSINGNVTSGGAFNPGNSPGTFTINGNLVLLSSSNLNMEIAGLDAGQYDIIDVKGDITLGGKMNIIVDTSMGYSGQLDDTFTPIKWLSSSGGSMAVASTTPGYSFDFSIDANGVSVVTALIPNSNQSIADLSSTEALVFTDTLKTYLDPFASTIIDIDEKAEDEKGQSLVCG